MWSPVSGGRSVDGWVARKITSVVYSKVLESSSGVINRRKLHPGGILVDC